MLNIIDLWLIQVLILLIKHKIKLKLSNDFYKNKVFNYILNE